MITRQIIYNVQKLQRRALVKVFTMIQEHPESLLSHAGESHQQYVLFCYHHRQSQGSIADSCEVDMLDDPVPVSFFRV